MKKRRYYAKIMCDQKFLFRNVQFFNVSFHFSPKTIKEYRYFKSSSKNRKGLK